MRLHILSDLHLEFSPFESPCIDADVVVLAGDINTGKNGILWIQNAFPNQPVVYVLGNHEFYGQKIPRLVDSLKQIAQGTNVHILENDEIRIVDVKFLGATLWTDFQLNGDLVLAEVAAQTGMTDFRRIRVTPSYRRFRPKPIFDSRNSLTLPRKYVRKTQLACWHYISCLSAIFSP